MKRSLWTLASLIIFISLLVWALWWKPDESMNSLWSIDFDDVVQIEIQSRGARNFIVQKEKDVWWGEDSKKRVELDKDRVRERFSSLCQLKSDRVLGNKEQERSALKSYGLEPPERVLIFTLTDGGEHALLIGTKTPLGRHYYVQLVEEGPIHMIPAFHLRDDLADLEELRKSGEEDKRAMEQVQGRGLEYKERTPGP